MRAAGRSELALLGLALALGALGDMILRSVPLGLNATVMGAGLTIALFAVQQGDRRGWERWACALAAILAGFGFCWRDSLVLKWLDAFALGIAVALLASGGRSEAPSLSRYLMRTGRTSVFVLPGPLPALTEVSWSDVRSPLSWRVLFGLGRGLLLAAPVLIVFAGLLASADVVFARGLRELVSVDISDLIGHAAAVFALGWIAAGVLWAGFRAPQGPPLPPRPAWLALGSIEIGTLLGLVDLLFGGFVWVQLRYLFGGTALVEGVSGLTYSQYARRGFFELAWVTALSLPLLLLAHWLLGHARRAVRRAVLALAGIQVALLLVMLASALERMRAYQDQYGQTELRFYTTAFMLWLGVLLVSFLLTVLPGRRGAFAQVATVSAFGALAILHAVNPDERIVVANRKGPRGFDLQYALTLSADAVPALLETAPSLPPWARQEIASRLAARWSAPEADFRTWSLARDRARREVARWGLGVAHVGASR
ncbi:MAG TPA: DUF4173 domain-containing protein [Vicinamibacteria bacterium]|nr:DUF4173 domain-containing protein [Vicinamibacteria bacterium]